MAKKSIIQGSELLKRFRRCDRASLAVLAALAMPVLVGLTGLAVDAGSWYVKKRSLQTAADAAAISGAYELSAGSSTADIESAALIDAEYNAFNETGTGVMELSTPPSTGAYVADNDAVEVYLSETVPLYFSSLFMDQEVTIKARSVAKHFTTSSFCMIALEDVDTQAMLFSGNVEIQMDCGIASNSTDAESIYASGSVNLQVTTAWSAGGIDYTGNVDFQADTMRENASTTDDPYADLAVPAFSGCDQDGLSITNTTTLSPGVYCNGLSLSGDADVTLEAGVYFIDRGDFSMSDESQLSGDGVTIILTSSTGADYGEISITGDTELSLSPPDDGTTAGVILFQDLNSPESGNAVFNGTHELSLTGAVYLPSQQLEFGGTGDEQELCVQLIARTIWVYGDVEMQSECDDEETEDASVTIVRQVE